MRVAVISDIHSNLTALQAVLADAEKRRAAHLWCLGDLVGYGPDPRACVALVRQRASLCLSGNHDLAAAGRLSLEDFNPHAAAAIRWTMAQLAADDRAFLEGQPTMAVTDADDGVTLAHGSPREPVWEYVLSSAIAAESFRCFRTRLCFVGHSHVPFHCPEPPPGQPYGLYPFVAGRPLPTTARRLIVNPGSVGQPRDSDPRASYVIFDTDAGLLYHHRVDYDIAATQERMRLSGLPQYLIDRLACGV